MKIENQIDYEELCISNILQYFPKNDIIVKLVCVS